MKNGHLSKETLQAFAEGILDSNGLILVAEHICNCERCADLLANSFDEKELVQAPLGFEEEVKSKIISKKEFVFYSLRVAMAACITLIFIFSGTLNFATNIRIGATNINPPDLRGVNTINNELNKFSQRIINMEVFNNEKEKK